MLRNVGFLTSATLPAPQLPRALKRLRVSVVLPGCACMHVYKDKIPRNTERKVTRAPARVITARCHTSCCLPHMLVTARRSVQLPKAESISVRAPAAATRLPIVRYLRLPHYHYPPTHTRPYCRKYTVHTAIRRPSCLVSCHSVASGGSSSSS